MQQQQGPQRDATMRPVSPIEAVEPARAPAPPGRRKRKKRKKSAGPAMRLLNSTLTALLLIFLTAGTAHVWLSYKTAAPGPMREDKLINIARGKTEHQIAEILEQHGVVESRYLFLAHQFSERLLNYLRQRKSVTLKAGDYRVKAASSVAEIAAIIRAGKSELISVAIPEGLTSYEIVRRLRANKNLTGDILEVPPEGALRPDTYRVRLQASRRDVLKLMARQQSRFLQSAWQGRQPSLPYKDIVEAVILASIVEKEMGPNDDPSRIAGVFVNRLRRGMRLQSDPTILYGKFGQKVAWGSKIYRSDIRRKTTHNTYQIDGLPPTPICNPGRAAIEAVMNPAQTNDLYFVADGKGGHIFSATLAEHNRAVAEWRKIERGIRAAQKAKSIAGTLRGSKAGAGHAQTSSAAADLLAPDGTPLPWRRPAR